MKFDLTNIVKRVIYDDFYEKLILCFDYACTKTIEICNLSKCLARIANGEKYIESYYATSALRVTPFIDHILNNIEFFNRSTSYRVSKVLDGFTELATKSGVDVALGWVKSGFKLSEKLRGRERGDRRGEEERKLTYVVKHIYDGNVDIYVRKDGITVINPKFLESGYYYIFVVQGDRVDVYECSSCRGILDRVGKLKGSTLKKRLREMCKHVPPNIIVKMMCVLEKYIEEICTHEEVKQWLKKVTELLRLKLVLET